jgi:hypothetical protein
MVDVSVTISLYVIISFNYALQTSGKVLYYFPCMTKNRSESRYTYNMCLNVHQQSFLRRQCPLLVLFGVVFSIEATDAHHFKP